MRTAVTESKVKMLTALPCEKQSSSETKAASTAGVRFGALDMLRHLLALAVVFLHMQSKSRYTASVNEFLAVSGNLVDGAVMGYFMISGFFVRPEKLTSWSQLSAWMVKTLVRLGQPFLLFSLGYGAIMSLLGKGAFMSAVYQTLTLQGSSMQLYFLPFLFIVSAAFVMVLFLAAGNAGGVERAPYVAAWGIAVFSLAWALLHPTQSSSGYNFLLLVMYVGCYALGYVIGCGFRKGGGALLKNGAVIVVSTLIAGRWDERFYDVSLMTFLLLAAAALTMAGWARNFALPGSGGVFLLHTPLVNFGVSSILLSLGIADYANLWAALILTYIICVAVTLACIRLFPGRKHLLLE